MNFEVKFRALLVLCIRSEWNRAHDSFLVTRVLKSAKVAVVWCVLAQSRCDEKKSVSAGIHSLRSYCAVGFIDRLVTRLGPKSQIFSQF